MITAREEKAQSLGWNVLVGDTYAHNDASAFNFLRAGFRTCQPQQPWCNYPATYWVKEL